MLMDAGCLQQLQPPPPTLTYTHTHTPLPHPPHTHIRPRYPSPGRCDNNPPDPTGEKHKCCSAATASVCPTAHGLDHISQLGLWTEGVAGAFHLEVQWIAAGMAHGAGALDAGLARPRAASKSAGKSQKQDWTSVCTGPIQKALRYNTSDVPSQLPGSAPDETQADAVCCDPNYKP